MTKVWFITGSSRGLGKSLTEAVLSNGDNVAASAKNTKQLNGMIEKYPKQMLILPLDVSDKAQIHSAIERAIEHFGRIDVLVNNAGFGITGAFEEFTDEQIQNQLEVNLYAPIEITKTALPYLRKQRSGNIFNICSIGGRVTSVGLSIYQTAKWGIAGFSEALSKEVKAFGINVTSIEPGGFRTDFAGLSMSFAEELTDYESILEPYKRYSATAIRKGNPDKAAKIIFDLAYHSEPPVHLILGSDAIALLEKANSERNIEMEMWKSISISTDFI